MQDYQAHTFQNTFLHTISYFICDFGMGYLSPPEQNVRVQQTALWQTVFRILERCCADFKRIIDRETFLDAMMDTLRINFANRFGSLFVDIFTPDDDSNLLHRKSKSRITA